MRFKAGDEVIGNAQANIRYSITCKDWKGVVTKVWSCRNDEENALIDVRSINSYTSYTVAINCFDLYEMFPEDVPL
jgi:hypothetical protein